MYWGTLQRMNMLLNVYFRCI